MNKNIDLNNPREVEEYIFDKDVSSKTRDLYLTAYQHFTEANDLDWNRPSIETETEPVKIPTEEKIDLVISSATSRYA